MDDDYLDQKNDDGDGSDGLGQPLSRPTPRRAGKKRCYSCRHGQGDWILTSPSPSFLYLHSSSLLPMAPPESGWDERWSHG